MVPSTGGCSRYLLIPNWHETPYPPSEEPSGPRSAQESLSRQGIWVPWPSIINNNLRSGWDLRDPAGQSGRAGAQSGRAGAQSPSSQTLPLGFGSIGINLQFVVKIS